MAHEEKNIGGGAELRNLDEEKIAGMLGSLARVEAPKDFDFHLKARIAKGRPEEARAARLFPVLRYVLPVALVAMVGAGIYLNSAATPGDTPVAVNSAPQPAASIDNNSIAAARPEPTATAQAPNVLPEVSRGDEQPKVAELTKKDPVGGSRDFIDRPSDPRGRSRDSAIAAPTPVNPPGTGKKYNAQEGLALIGISADFESGRWTVKSVKASEVADHIGVKAGDKIIAIDGKVIDDKTEFDGGVTVSVIRVDRGGETRDLKAGGKPE